jgi:signal transduction histidine kinase
MATRNLRSNRRVVWWFLALVLAPSLLLVALGWRLFDQDRVNAMQQLQDRRSRTADLVVAAVERAIVATEQALRDDNGRARLAAHDDAMTIVFEGDRLSLSPGGRLAYSPRPWPGLNLSDARGQARTLLRSIRSATGAAKLELLSNFSRLDAVAVENVPAELFARVARFDVLQELDRRSELEREAAEVRSDLKSGRWSISRVVYDANLRAAEELLPDDAPSPTNAEMFAMAVDTWWRSPSGRALPAGRSANDAGVTTTWTSDDDRTVLLIALPAFIEREWMSEARALAGRDGTEVTLKPAQYRGNRQDAEDRPASTTGLPWTVVLSHADGAGEVARLNGARSMWLAGLATLALVLTAGGYLVTRAVAGELAVARLQADFVAAVSHEFRTPLTSMRQLTEILVDKRVPEEDRRHSYYLALARQTERLHRLVESLLDLGRLEAGRTPYRLEPLDACALVRAVVEDFQREPLATDVRIDLQINAVLSQVAGDRDALTNALWNLLDNAVKYSPGSNTVSVWLERTGDQLKIHVRDQGIGIPVEEHRAIFVKFVRGARATAEGFKGTGIGLSIVSHIMKAHGGDVQVESAPGNGSTFTLSLPLLSPANQPAGGSQT